MHSAIVAACFILIVLVPCLAAVYSSSKEGHTGNSGEHEAAQVSAKERPSRLRMVAQAAFSKADASVPAGKRTSRMHRVAAALTKRDAKAYVPMVAGDPGERRQSIRDLRAKHSSAAKPTRNQTKD